MSEIKENLAYEKLVKGLDLRSEFKDKKSYLDEHKYIEKAYTKFPGLKKRIGEYMLSSVIEEYGAGSDRFQFSKEVSDAELLRSLNIIDKNKEVLETEFGGKEGIAELRLLVNEKNVAYDDISKRKEEALNRVHTLRQEFDDRVGHFTTPAPTMIIPGLNTWTKGMVQGIAGWTDYFQSEGLERIESRDLNWDPETKKFGPGPEIGEEQDILRDIYKEEEELDEKYKGVSSKVRDLNQLIKENTARTKKIDESGLSEAIYSLQLISPDSSMIKLKEMLGN